MNPTELQSWLEQSGALRSGHFRLSSGLHSETYVQCALLLESPQRADVIGKALARAIAVWEPDSVISPALGGVIIGYCVARELRTPFRFTERSQGDMVLRRGFGLEPGERVVIVEDVVTTGRSTEETAAVVERYGATVCGVGAILDRTNQPRTFALELKALMELRLSVFPPERCPQCRQGEGLTSPGSRHVS